MNCPNCGAPVSGNCCEYCGSTLSQENITINITNNYYGNQPQVSQPAPVQKPKRKTWLWVLGWIFIFPVPLMILLLRNKRLHPALKIAIIATAWILYILFVISGNDQPESLQAICML